MHAYQPERLKNYSTSKNLVVQTIADYPALFAGATLSVIVMSSIFVNAVWYQQGKHPSPMFSTRGESIVKRLNAKNAVQTPTVKPATVAVVEPIKPNPVELSDSSVEILREVQTALSVRGYYSGKLDGVYGSRTKNAIVAFQRDQSLPDDGKVSVRLLTQVLMSASARPEAVPVQKAIATTKVKPMIKRVAVSKPSEIELPDGLIARIQSGLRTYGYDDIKVDGKMGQQTATAIQRFQLDYGMKITGEPSDQVLRKLKDIGAYRNG